jgi:hypothetical protein
MIADRVSVEVGGVMAVSAEIEGEADRIQAVRYQSGSMFISFLAAALAMNKQHAAARGTSTTWLEDATDQLATPRRKREFLRHSRFVHM